jgi:DNA replication licensing factor MCM4
LINTGAGSATRRIRGDLKREVCPPFHIPDYAPLHPPSPSFPAPFYNCIGKTSANIQIMQLVDQAGRQGLRWTAAIRALEQQSSIPIDHSEFAEVVKGLTDEGVVRIVGERERRTIRRLAD